MCKCESVTLHDNSTNKLRLNSTPFRCKEHILKDINQTSIEKPLKKYSANVEM